LSTAVVTSKQRVDVVVAVHQHLGSTIGTIWAA
jgi:hypothetical protein